MARPFLLPAVDARTGTSMPLAKGRLPRMVQEPEDARMTGVTRSLHRRLLALNIGGSLLRPVPAAKLA